MDTKDIGRIFWSPLKLDASSKRVHIAPTFQVEEPFYACKKSLVLRLWREHGLVLGVWRDYNFSEQAALLAALQATEGTPLDKTGHIRPEFEPDDIAAASQAEARESGRTNLMRLTDDPTDPRLGYGSDSTPTSQHETYLVLSDADRAAGFVRPVRRTYVHETCGVATSMGQKIAETYARQPDFYGSTYCVHCQMHRPVGPDGEFVWDDDGSKVGT